MRRRKWVWRQGLRFFTSVVAPIVISSLYGGGFLDETWTRTGGDFKAELERFGVEVVEYNMLEHPELVEKLNLRIDPYNPFSSLARFLIGNKEVSQEEFFQKIRGTQERAKDENRD